MKPTLQIDDDTLPNVYACGDVAETHTPNPNARAAMRQAEVVADNILLDIYGKKPRYPYKPQWGDGLIKLTLGLVSIQDSLGNVIKMAGRLLLTQLNQDRSVLQFWDGKSELLFPSQETDLALMSDGTWVKMGAKPFVDTGEMKA